MAGDGNIIIGAKSDWEAEILNAIEKAFAEDEYYSVGQNLTKALRNGIASGEAELRAKAAETAAAMAKFKGMFGINSPSAVFRDEIGKMLMLDPENGITQNAADVLAAVEELSQSMLESEKFYLEEKERLELLNGQEEEARREEAYQRRLAAAKTWEEQEKIIEEERFRLRKRADEKYLEQLKAAADEEKKAVRRLKADLTQAYKEIAEYIEESLEPIDYSREKLEIKLKKYAEENNSGAVKNIIKGSGETVVTYGGEKIVDEDITFHTLADQRKSIETLERYRNALNSLRERTAEIFDPQTAREFMRTAADMSVEEGAIFAETLAGTDEGQFKKYIEDWKTKNSLAEEISAQFYGREFTEAVDGCAEYVKTELEKLGLEIPDGFFDSGSLSAAEFGKGFSRELENVLENARAMIESFGNYSVSVSGGSGTQVVNNNNYYSSYSVNGTKSSAAESIYAMEAAAVMNKYRGIEQ